MSDCETYEVEKIVAYRITDGKEYYKVRWAGFTEEDDTWEPYENLNEACRLMIKDIFGHFPDSSESEKSGLVFEENRLDAADKRCFSNVVMTDESIISAKSRSRSSKKSSGKVKKPSLTKAFENGSRFDGKVNRRKIKKRRHYTDETQNSGKDVNQRPERLCFETLTTARTSASNEKRFGSILDLASLNLLDPLSHSGNNEREAEKQERNLAKPAKEIKKCRISACTDSKSEHYQQDRGEIGTDEAERSANVKVDENQILTNSFVKKDITDEDEDPLIRQYPSLPVNKVIGLNVEELDMAIFMSKESSFTEKLENFEDFRSAALAGNVIAVRNCIKQLKCNPSFHLDNKFNGKTLIIEICEMKCDGTHYLDDILQELVRAGARLDVADDVYRRTPLHFAVLNGLWCRVRILLMLRSPVNLKDCDGKTPLEIALSSRASKFNIKRAIYLLLEHGADVYNIIESEPKCKFVDNLLEYDKKVRTLLEVAVAKVIVNMTTRTTVTPIMIRGLWEFDNCNYTGELSFNYSTPELPNEKCFFCVIFAIFHSQGPHARIRLWGESPLTKVSLNNEAISPLQPESNGFLFPVNLSSGVNKLQFWLKSEFTRSKLLLLTQIVVLEPCKGMTILSHSPVKATKLKNLQ